MGAEERMQRGTCSRALLSMPHSLSRFSISARSSWPSCTQRAPAGTWSVSGAMQRHYQQVMWECKLYRYSALYANGMEGGGATAGLPG